jgi:hypothetical protein
VSRKNATAGVTAGLFLELVLVAAVTANLGFEVAWGSTPLGGSAIWPTLQAGVTGVALLVALAWRRQLRLPFVLGLGLAFSVASIAVHLAVGMPSDFDSDVVYPAEGHVLLSGHYPRSEYPPGAVLLFAFETFVGGGSTRVSNAFMMVPFQLVTVLSIWLFRTTWAPWLATFVAVWPLNEFYWEFKFDSAPTALAVAGLVLAVRGRWALSGVLFGLGAAVKWTPALIAVGLVVWLLSSGKPRDAVRHGIFAAATFFAVNLPFLIANPPALLHAYTAQGGRGIIGESLPYLPLRALGLAHIREEVWDAADVPSWANVAALGLQATVVLSLLVLLVVWRRNRHAGIAVAAMLPVAFLLTNRVFSAQFIIPLLVSWAAAAAILGSSTRGIVLFFLLVTTASFCNALVYPGGSRFWVYFSWGLFVSGLAATGWVVARAATEAGRHRRSRSLAQQSPR